MRAKVGSDTAEGKKGSARGWYIVRRDETSLLTSLGEVVYHKTLFKNVDTGESCYQTEDLMVLHFFI